MEPITISTLFAAALGYILKGAAQSKAAETAKEELLGGFWQWIRPLFIKDIPEIEENPEEIDVETRSAQKLRQLMLDEGFSNDLAGWVDKLKKAGIKEINFIEGNLTDIDEITIGDTTYSPNDKFDRKNFIKGDIKRVKKITIGDR
ncbi:MAG TPA: hypothetical protein PK263_06125 [bacterium]|nr:hypothetical protein [bacterium]